MEQKALIIAVALIAALAVAAVAVMFLAPMMGQPHYPYEETEGGKLYRVVTMDRDVLLPLDLSNPELNKPPIGIDIHDWGGEQGKMWFETGVVATLGVSASLSVRKTDSLWRLVNTAIEGAVNEVHKKARELGGTVSKIEVYVEIKGMQAIIDNEASGGSAGFEISYGATTRKVDGVTTVSGRKLWIPLNLEFSGTPTELSSTLPSIMYSAKIWHTYTMTASAHVKSTLRDVGLAAHIRVVGEIFVPGR